MSRLNRYYQSIYDVERIRFVTDLTHLVDKTIDRIPELLKPGAEDAVKLVSDAIKGFIPYLPPAIEGSLKNVLDEEVAKIDNSIKEIYNKLDSFMCEGEPDEPHSKKRRICCYSYTPISRTPGSGSGTGPGTGPSPGPGPSPHPHPEPHPEPPSDPGEEKIIYIIFYWDLLCFVFNEEAWIYKKPINAKTRDAFNTTQSAILWKHEPPIVVKDFGNKVEFKFPRGSFLYETGALAFEKPKPEYVPSFLKDLNSALTPQHHRASNFEKLLEIFECYSKIVFLYCNNQVWTYDKPVPSPRESKLKYFTVPNITTVDDASVYDNGLLVRFEFENFSYWFIPVNPKLSPKHRKNKLDWNIGTVALPPDVAFPT